MRNIHFGLKEYNLYHLYCAYLCLSKQTTNIFFFVKCPYHIYFKTKLALAVLNMPYFCNHRIEFAKRSVREQSSG